MRFAWAFVAGFFATLALVSSMSVHGYVLGVFHQLYEHGRHIAIVSSDPVAMAPDHISNQIQDSRSERVSGPAPDRGPAATNGLPAVPQGTMLVDIKRSAFTRQCTASHIFDHARLVPRFERGVSFGYSLYAIRPGSLLAMLGLRNGDVVVAVNGMDMTSPLCPQATVDTPDFLDIEIRRAGTPMRLVVLIHDDLADS